MLKAGTARTTLTSIQSADELGHTILLADAVNAKAKRFVDQLTSAYEQQELPNLCQIAVDSTELTPIKTFFGDVYAGITVTKQQSAVALNREETFCLLLTGEFVVRIYEYDSNTLLSKDTGQYQVFDVHALVFSELRRIEEFLTVHTAD